MKSGVFCIKHDRIHLGFEDRSTACELCIEELISCRSTEDLRQISHDAVGCLNPDDGSVEEFRQAVETALPSADGSGPMVILRFIAAKAVRTGQTIEAVLLQMVQNRSAKYILS